MLATASRALVGAGWAFEPKLDGWRAVIHVRGGQVTVYSRPGRDMTSSVPQLAGLVDAVPDGSVLDGEIVAGTGRASSFYRLAPELGTTRAPVSFAAFDLLARDGRSLLGAPYEERRRLLVGLAFLGPAWCTVPAWIDAGVADLLAACEIQGLEGFVAKRLPSRYRPGRRSPDWVKLKTVAWTRDHAPRRRPELQSKASEGDPTSL